MLNRIDSPEKLKLAISDRFSNRQEFLTWMLNKGFHISKSMLSRHLNQDRGFTEWHVIAYSMAIALYDVEKKT